MLRPANHPAEDASRKELLWASLRLLVMLLALTFLVVPILRDLPFGATTRIGLLAWLLVALVLYWMYAGLGYRALLLSQLFVFSTAATLLTAKAILVIMGIERFSILRRTARGLILIGAAMAGVNLGFMLVGMIRRRQSRQKPVAVEPANRPTEQPTGTR
jgi:hypothetical protein